MRNNASSQSKRSAGSEGAGTQAAATSTEPSPFTAPAINLPKGGGAIRGMGEKFAANPVTGTGSMSVPIATSPGRAGFGPQLALAYDSGAGNGPFGFGWSLSLPAITRKTDKGLPRYNDAAESDVFLLSGTEDLVPVLVQNAAGEWEPETLPPHTVGGQTYNIKRYRPRIEGLFACIERWTDAATGEIHWRSISRDNITTLYGKDNDSRIFDPADPDPAHPTRIFSWLICQSYDDKGNAVIYEYQSEDSRRIFEDQQGQFVARAHEQNRSEASRSANRYLKRIKYGNRVPNRDTVTGQAIDPTQLPDDTWMFEVVFDYGEHDTDAPEPNDDDGWPCRNDPFSTYRAGFEVRTYRLCQRVLMFHHIPDLSPEEKGYDGLVRSTDFEYSHEVTPDAARDPIYSFLLSVTHCGYKRNNDGYLKRSLPPVAFEYTQPIVQDVVEEVDSASLENLPAGLNGGYQWTDLHGEGLPGILTEQGGAWFYKRNLSPTNVRDHNGARHVEAQFAPVELVGDRPNQSLAAGAQFMDLAGDGQPDLVVLDGPLAGLYEHDDGESWGPFRPFTDRLSRDIRDPNLRFVDLNGDGHADVLITENDVFVWHPSLAEAGFGPALRVAQALDEEKGPRLVFADGEQAIYLADMSGDGLTDLARVRNGEVCYWPNLGYGRFGPKVTMDNSPWFDNSDQFEQQRVRLADIDGSGNTDIIYLHRDGVRLYFNQSGNGWGLPQTLDIFPQVDSLSDVTTADLLGNGTACLVWSSPLPRDARRPLRYVNLMGDEKPHLLVRTVNNLGAETRVHYAPSTKFYLQDKQDGRPWISRLPFPVHVVERVETYDHISRNRFVTRYAYHHGYFDGEEREFRGFGMVEQFDTEEFAALTASGQLPPGDNEDPASHVPTVLTRTWFHTGLYLGRDHVSRFFAGLLDEADKGEYYREPGLDDAQAAALLLDDTTLPDGLTLDEERQAARALKGMMLRQEVYALDGIGASADYPHGHPYTVAEQNFTVRMLQPQTKFRGNSHQNGNGRARDRHAVFFAHPREALTYHYEREPADPRIQHALTLEVDEFGNVLKSAAVGYGRRQHDAALPTDDDRDKQALIHITYTDNTYTKAITGQADHHRTPLPAESRTYELRKAQQEKSPPGLTRLYCFDDLLRCTEQAADGNHDIAYEDMTFARAQQVVAAEPAESDSYFRRLIERVRTTYRKDDLSALLAPGDLEPLALPGESYKLALTPGLLAAVLKRRRADGTEEDLQPPNLATLLAGPGEDEGGYVALDGNWWIPSGRVFCHPDDVAAAAELAEAQANFFLPRRYRDPFGHNATVEYDGYDLLVTRTEDAVQNVVLADNDYRVLGPRLMTDPNRNRTEVVFDALGLVAGTAVMGKPVPAPVEGDSLEDFEPDLTQAQIDGFFDVEDPHVPAPGLLKGATTRIIYDLDRFQRTREDHPDDRAQWLPACAATLARETHVHDELPPQGLKIQVSFSYSDGYGREIQQKIQAEPGPLVEGGPVVNPRWVGSGWTVFNNKGKPVRQYEPFFSKRERGDGTFFSDHHFEFGVEVGVSPILFYDPAERVVATLHPNHTWEKVVFDPWQQTTHDVNDTVLVADPATDADVGDFFRRLADAEYRPTWHALRTDPAHTAEFIRQYPDPAARAAETAAANKAALHARTPAVAHFDTLGRPFLTIAHNRFARNGATIEEFYPTRVELDIEGNQRVVRDAVVQAGGLLGRIVMTYDYDMLGNPIHQASMEAGERWMLNDATGNPIRTFDSRGFIRRLTYDELRRPTGLFVTEPAGERLAERTIYGEGKGEATNHRSRVFQVFDGAGVVTSELYDFKGNLLSGHRRLLVDHRTPVNWLANPAQQGGDPFTSSTTYDALNRPLAATSPDGSVYRPTFNEANLLNAVTVDLEGVTTPFVTNIDYDAKGQRERIAYANGATTTYTYDPLTFRLTHLKTTRPSGTNGLGKLFKDPTVVQDLRYAYDPAGNITHIEDAALPTIFHNNERVEPVGDYTYDAAYRLVEAHGREHIGQTAFDFDPPDGNFRDYPFVGLRANANNPEALRTYTERYDYDEVGNFRTMRHSATNGSWTRTYAYDEPSLLEPAERSNRLSSTTIGNGFSHPTEEYHYDAHGNMTRMPHLGNTADNMHWDFEDQLQRVDLPGGETACYVYDVAGQRVRKVIEAADGTPREERLYLGGFELFRRHRGADAGLERRTLHVMDDQQRIALVETRNDVNDGTPRQVIRYQLGNHLGSSGAELDAAAALISYEEYQPYGTTSFQAVRSDVEMAAKRYRYTRMERDEKTGLSYHTSRYYAAWVGRWLSTDRTGLNDGLNLYAYVNCNPTRFRDSSGMNGDDQTDPTNNIKVHGKKGLQSQEPYLNIAEPMTVGEEGISTNEARARALDVNNREILDHITNQKTQKRGVPNRPLPPPKAPISVTKDPHALLTRRFSEITEMRAIFDKVVRGIKNPHKYSPTELKGIINGRIWSTIRSGRSIEAKRVSDALASIGAEFVPGKGYRLGKGPAGAPALAPTQPKNMPVASAPAAQPKNALVAPVPVAQPKNTPVAPAPRPQPRTITLDPAPKGVGGAAIAVAPIIVKPVTKYVAKELGADEDTADLLGSILSGGTAGAIMGAPAEGIGAIPGAIIGGAIGGAGYLLENYELCWCLPW